VGTETSSWQPQHTDVLVVGGGIAGCAAAYYLARSGADVLLVEQFDLNTQASGRNAGSLHGQIQHEPFVHLGEEWARTFLPALAVLADSLAMWDSLSEELGVDLEVRRHGGLLVAETEEQLADIRRKVQVERSVGLPMEVLSASELQHVAPYVSKKMAGAEFAPMEGKANPLLVAPAFANSAIRAGAKVRTWTQVTSIEQDSHGFRLHTNTGVITCRKLVCTAGANLPLVGAMLGLRLPITSEPVQVNVTEPVAPLVKHLVYFAGEKLTLKQSVSGSLLIGGGWPARPDAHGNPIVNPESLRSNLRVAKKVVPAIGRAKLIRTWVGVGNGTPDHRPMIGEIAGIPGLIIGIFPYMGFTAGPLLGRILADITLGREVDRDMKYFAPDRF
jgi:sarcosine oxidase subunit beta